MSLKLSTAENLVRKTWTESSGKKITKHHYNSVIKKFYFNTRNLDLSSYYENLLPYINRSIHISKLQEEEFIKNESAGDTISSKTFKIKNSIEKQKELLLKKMEENQSLARSRRWTPSPYWDN